MPVSGRTDGCCLGLAGVSAAAILRFRYPCEPAVPTNLIRCRIRVPGAARRLGTESVAMREDERRLLEVPAEVDLGTGDLVLVVKGENLGIPSPSTAGGVGLIGNDHLVARLDQPDKLEALAAAGAGPATLEVAVTVELWVRWRREEKVIAQALLEEAPVAGCERGI